VPLGRITPFWESRCLADNRGTTSASTVRILSNPTNHFSEWKADIKEVQKHLISERRLAGRDGTVNQALTGAKATGFLERPITARCSVPKPMPVSVEIERQGLPLGPQNGYPGGVHGDTRPSQALPPGLSSRQP
jgi:hypothetical protein